MKFSEEQYLALKQASKKRKLDPKVDKQQEFTSFGEGQPGSVLKFLFERIQNLSPEQKKEIEDICEQVSVPEEVLDIAQEKLKEIGEKYATARIREFKESLYDPSARAALFRRSILRMTPRISHRNSHGFLCKTTVVFEISHGCPSSSD